MAPSENARPARWTSLSASAGLWLVTALALLRLPAAPPVDPGLDPSWRLCLGYLLQHGMQFGSQVVFTFGPLGFAVFGVYPGSGFWLQMGAAAAVAGMLAWMLLATVRPMHWGWKAAAVLSFLLLIAPHLQALHFLSAALLGLLLLREEKKPGLRNIAACSAALGFLSAMKFPNLMLAAGCVGVAAGYYLFVSNWRRAAAIAGGFVLAFLAWWTVCGQSPLEIPSYCINSLHVTSGYGGAMAVYTKAPDWIGPLTMLILLTYGVFETAAARWQARSVAMAFIFLGTTYLAWRHATVRADISHSLGLYLWTSAIVALNPAFFPAQPRWRPFKIAFLAALAACAVVGIYQIEFDVIARCAPVFAEKMRENAAAVANLPAFESDLNARYSSVARQNAAPRIVDTVKNDSVDVLGFEQSIAILNRLNYRPRPIFQSYVAYAPKLEEMNAAYLAGPHAPDWVLQRYESINHHYPGSEDALALRTLLDRYTYQFQDSGYILWRRTGDQALVALPPPARQGDSAMNRKIQLGDLAGKDLWLEVDYSYSLLGSLRQLFFKPPIVRLEIATSADPDSRQKYLFPRLMAQSGMLLSPCLEGEFDFLKYATGQGGQKVLSFEIKCDRADLKYLKRSFHYRLRVLPAPYNLAANRAMADRIRQYPMLETAPSHVESASPSCSTRLDGRDTLQVTAPSRIEYPAPAGGGRLSGAYGLKMDEEFFAGREEKPAAEFQAVLHEGAAERVLLDRVLQPGTVSGDRGLQQLDIALPPAAPGATVVLTTIPKTPNLSGGSLTCWTALRVQPH